MKHHMNSINQNKEVKIVLVKHLNDLIAKKIATKKYDSITIACIGTDRVNGDSLGPFVGEFLGKKKWENVSIIGNLERPVDAKNIEERISQIPSNSLVIAIDACLGKLESIGCVKIEDKPLHPGAAFNKGLSPVGDISITGIVNLSGGLDFMTLQNTRLYTVIELAKTIVNVLSEVIPFVNLEITEELEEIIA